MIAYFPEPYNDELLYSLLARYAVHSGYMIYRSVAEELLANPLETPSTLFFNELRPEVINLLCNGKSFQEIIFRHTMAPYYMRFMDKEKRDTVVSENPTQPVSVPLTALRYAKTRYLRYCPVCVKKDRQKHGETYWHRNHQIYGIAVCPEHGCELIESPVLNRTAVSSDYISAESVVVESETRYVSEQMRKFAMYVSEVMNSEIPCDNDVEIGRFLDAMLTGTKYRSGRGQQRNTSILLQDMKSAFADCKEGITETRQIQRMLKGYRKNPLGICQMGYFLNISAKDLTNPSLPEETPEQRFDKIVAVMIGQGNSIIGISRNLHVAPKTVRLSCERLGIKSVRTRDRSLSEKQKFEQRLRLERQFWETALKDYPNLSFTRLCKLSGYLPHLQWLRENDRDWTDMHWPQMTAHNSKKLDWDRMDRETLPLVKSAIRKLQGENGERPRRVTVSAVNKILGFPIKRMYSLPRCKEEILRHEQSHEEYWAMEFIWAVHRLLSTGEPINYMSIRNLTNMRRGNIEKCHNVLIGMGKEHLYEMVNGSHQ